MSSINKLEMASALLKNSHISIHKSFFGLKQKAIYVPTGSKLTVMVNEYDNENAALVENILNTEDARLENEIRRSGVIKSSPIGGLRLEVVITADHQFVAAQTFRYIDLRYKAVTTFRIFEGKSAEIFSTIL